jgi:hypothetical protein
MKSPKSYCLFLTTSSTLKVIILLNMENTLLRSNLYITGSSVLGEVSSFLKSKTSSALSRTLALLFMAVKSNYSPGGI